MGTILNYYHILGVSNCATFNEIKEAYRNKVKEYHPDKENGNAELFKRVKEAYNVLQNSEKRKEYDDLLFRTVNHLTHHPKQATPSRTNPNLAVVNIGRRSRNSFSSLTINTTLILIGVLGNAYLKKRR